MSFDLRARRTTYAYGVPDSLYRKGYHRGIDKGADGGEVAQWLSSGTVTQITRNANIGTWVETTNELGVGGAFIGYGHTRAPDGLKVGDRVTAGADGPIVNGWGDDHGTDWGGPHVHVWTGDVSGDMGVAFGNDLDPTPIFSARPASGVTYEEDENMKVIVHRDESGATEEVALISPELFTNGYVVAKGTTEIALGWLRTYSPKLDGTPHATLNRDAYLGAIGAAKAARTAYLAGRPQADPKPLASILAAIRALPAAIIKAKK